MDLATKRVRVGQEDLASVQMLGISIRWYEPDAICPVRLMFSPVKEQAENVIDAVSNQLKNRVHEMMLDSGRWCRYELRPRSTSNQLKNRVHEMSNYCYVVVALPRITVS